MSMSVCAYILPICLDQDRSDVSMSPMYIFEYRIRNCFQCQTLKREGQALVASATSVACQFLLHCGDQGMCPQFQLTLIQLVLNGKTIRHVKRQ